MRAPGILAGALLALTCSSMATAEMTADVAGIRDSWADINYQKSGKQQNEAMSGLVEQCGQLTKTEPDNAQGLTWCGIVNSSYAGMAGALSAMKYAKSARGMLTRSIELQPGALDGAAETSLGTLYGKVPGWPIGFGDDDKAEQWLKKGLEIAPQGIDSNYFYADFLFENDEPEKSRTYLETAKKAAPRPDREVADGGRQLEIDMLLSNIDQQLAER